MGCLIAKHSLSADEASDFESVYKQIQLLGRGSFGDVVEAEHLKTGTRYAVKKIKITDKNRKMVDFGNTVLTGIYAERDRATIFLCMFALPNVQS